MNLSHPAAVLWDMDGTIVDTEPYWLLEQAELVHSFGGEWTHDDGLSLVGSGLWNAASVLQGRGVDLDQDTIVNTLTDRVLDRVKVHMPWRPGAQQLLSEVRDAGIPTVLVTMSIRPMADYIVSAIPFSAFDYVVSGDEVSDPKPHPEPYLRGARLVGADIRDCVAIEDSTTGLASAVASGAVAIGVPLHSPLDEKLGYTIWPTLEGRTLADLDALLALKRPRTSNRGIA